VPFPFAFARLNALQAAVRHSNKLSKADWQNTCPVSDDMMWDIHQIDLQVDCNVKNGFTDARMKGVWVVANVINPFFQNHILWLACRYWHRQ